MSIGKTKLIFAFSIMLFNKTEPTFGQNSTEFGIKGGLNLTAISTTVPLPLAARNNFVSYHVGCYFLYKKNKIGIQPEVFFSGQGQHFYIYPYSSYQLRLNYVNVPVVIKYYLRKGLNIQAGPQFGYLVSGTGTNILLNTGQKNYVDLRKVVKSFDLSLGFGFGWDNLPFGLSFTARVNFGLININKSEGLFASFSPPYSYKVANQSIQFSLGYRL